MVYVICRTYEHFKNWLREQDITTRHATPLLNSKDVQKIQAAGREKGFVKLTPTWDPRWGEALLAEMKARDFYELSHDINEWPLTEFPTEERKKFDLRREL